MYINQLFLFSIFNIITGTVKPLLRGHPVERPTPLERPLDQVNLNINVLISTPDERPPLLKGLFPDAKGVASQEGFHCTQNMDLHEMKILIICSSYVCLLSVTMIFLKRNTLLCFPSLSYISECVFLPN